MQFELEEISPVKKKVNVTIPADQVDAEIERFFEGIQKRVKLQGFRPGKAPMQLVKRTYHDAMQGEVKNRICIEALSKVVEEHNIELIASPAIESDILEQGIPFKFSAIVEVMPEVHLQEYDGLVVNREKYLFKPESIDLELKRLQESMAELIPLSGEAAVENGHTVTIDYHFTVEGFPEESSIAEDAEVEVGANRHVKGFEEQLVGMKCGETKEIQVTLPIGYRYSKVDGKTGTFQVALKVIKRKVLPELDDEFAQQCGAYGTMQKLREKLAEEHEKHEVVRIENELKARIIKTLTQKNPLEAPEALVERQLDRMVEIFRNNQQASFEMMQFDFDGFRDHFRNDAAERVRGGLLLKALAEKENIMVEDGDLEKRYGQIAAISTDSVQSIRRYYESNPAARESLMVEIRESKAIDYLLDHAVINEVDASEL